MAVSKPIFASKCSLESSLRDLSYLHPFPPLESSLKTTKSTSSKQQPPFAPLQSRTTDFGSDLSKPRPPADIAEVEKLLAERLEKGPTMQLLHPRCISLLQSELRKSMFRCESSFFRRYLCQVCQILEGSFSAVSRPILRADIHFAASFKLDKSCASWNSSQLKKPKPYFAALFENYSRKFAPLKAQIARTILTTVSTKHVLKLV